VMKFEESRYDNTIICTIFQGFSYTGGDNRDGEQSGQPRAGLPLLSSPQKRRIKRGANR
jgi:hypothetical protein